MLTNLHIRHFRGIRQLDITDLGRVNLILGTNEAGKTSVMAAAALVHDLEMAVTLPPFDGPLGHAATGSGAGLLYLASKACGVA